MSTQAGTRDRLVRTASKLFLARSYHSVGVNEICSEAGAQKGSFYHFFPTKSDLAVAVIDHHAAAMWALHEEYEAAAIGAVARLRVTPEVVRSVQTRLYTSFGRIVGCPLGNMAVELATVEDSAAARVGQVLQQWERRVARHAHDVAEAGRLRRGVDPDELATRVIATMQGMILLAKINGGGPDAIPAAMHRVIDSGLVARKAA
ncbi:MAG TPA: TetR/AcrR family transcriptional regulator [Sporichthyaceae bacterium]|nr:TetR/AcrR family transcriptional regulator [Sporichthyaceae bacterium]